MGYVIWYVARKTGNFHSSRDVESWFLATLNPALFTRERFRCFETIRVGPDEPNPGESSRETVLVVSSNSTLTAPRSAII